MGEQVNEKLRKHVVDTMTAKGIQAVAPALTPQYSIRISPKYGAAATWSERHAAYASGLGTFGLCDGLITPVGKAMRTASVVAAFKSPPHTDLIRTIMSTVSFSRRGFAANAFQDARQGPSRKRERTRPFAQNI